MAEGIIALPPDSTGKKLRSRERTVGANSVHEQYVIPTSERVDTFDGFAATFRVQGTATTPINMLTVENTTGSAVLVGIKRISVDISASAVTAYMLQSIFRLYRTTTVPTGGTVVSKFGVESTQASAANVIIRGPASADGTASVITHALPAGTPMRSSVHPGIFTGVGQWDPVDVHLWNFDLAPLTVRPGECVLLALAGGAASATNFGYTVKAIWEEYTIP